jgi:hypothetical protein
MQQGSPRGKTTSTDVGLEAPGSEESPAKCTEVRAAVAAEVIAS